MEVRTLIDPLILRSMKYKELPELPMRGVMSGTEMMEQRGNVHRTRDVFHGTFDLINAFKQNFVQQGSPGMLQAAVFPSPIGFGPGFAGPKFGAHYDLDNQSIPSIAEENYEIYTVDDLDSEALIEELIESPGLMYESDSDAEQAEQFKKPIKQKMSRELFQDSTRVQVASKDFNVDLYEGPVSEPEFSDDELDFTPLSILKNPILPKKPDPLAELGSGTVLRSIAEEEEEEEEEEVALNEPTVFKNSAGSFKAKKAGPRVKTSVSLKAIAYAKRKSIAAKARSKISTESLITEETATDLEVKDLTEQAAEKSAEVIGEIAPSLLLDKELTKKGNVAEDSEYLDDEEELKKIQLELQQINDELAKLKEGAPEPVIKGSVAVTVDPVTSLEISREVKTQTRLLASKLPQEEPQGIVPLTSLEITSDVKPLTPSVEDKLSQEVEDEPQSTFPVASAQEVKTPTILVASKLVLDSELQSTNKVASLKIAEEVKSPTVLSTKELPTQSDPVKPLKIAEEVKYPTISKAYTLPQSVEGVPHIVDPITTLDLADEVNTPTLLSAVKFPHAVEDEPHLSLAQLLQEPPHLEQLLTLRELDSGLPTPDVDSDIHSSINTDKTELTELNSQYAVELSPHTIIDETIDEPKQTSNITSQALILSKAEEKSQNHDKLNKSSPVFGVYPLKYKVKILAELFSGDLPAKKKVPAPSEKVSFVSKVQNLLKVHIDFQADSAPITLEENSSNEEDNNIFLKHDEDISSADTSRDNLPTETVSRSQRYFEPIAASNIIQRTLFDPLKLRHSSDGMTAPILRRIARGSMENTRPEPKQIEAAFESDEVSSVAEAKEAEQLNNMSLGEAIKLKENQNTINISENGQKDLLNNEPLLVKDKYDDIVTEIITATDKVDDISLVEDTSIPFVKAVPLDSGVIEHSLNSTKVNPDLEVSNETVKAVPLDSGVIEHSLNSTKVNPDLEVSDETVPVLDSPRSEVVPSSSDLPKETTDLNIIIALPKVQAEDKVEGSKTDECKQTNEIQGQLSNKDLKPVIILNRTVSIAPNEDHIPVIIMSETTLPASNELDNNIHVESHIESDKEAAVLQIENQFSNEDHKPVIMLNRTVSIAPNEDHIPVVILNETTLPASNELDNNTHVDIESDKETVVLQIENQPSTEDLKSVIIPNEESPLASNELDIGIRLEYPVEYDNGESLTSTKESISTHSTFTDNEESMEVEENKLHPLISSESEIIENTVKHNNDSFHGMLLVDDHSTAWQDSTFDALAESSYVNSSMQDIILKDSSLFQNSTFDEYTSSDILEDPAVSKLWLQEAADNLREFPGNSSFTSLDKSIANSPISEHFNPVIEELKLDPSTKELHLDLRRSCMTFDSDLISERTAIIKPTSNHANTAAWIAKDVDGLLSVDVQRELSTSLNLSNAVALEDKQSLLSLSGCLYLSNAIINPIKLLKLYSDKKYSDKKRACKRKLVIDFKLNNFIAIQGYLDIIKFLSILKPTGYFRTNLIHIEVKLYTANEANARFAFNKLKSIGSLFDSIKVLGLLQLSPDETEDKFSYPALNGQTNTDNMVRFPNHLEKLVVSNRFNLDEGMFLPGSLRFAAFYGCNRINLSKFNLTKKLDKLHINLCGADKFELVKNGRMELFPPTFFEARELKLSAKMLVSLNFEKFFKLASLTLCDLDYKTTRQLRFPPMLKELVLEDCLISSHLISFPATLKKLVIRNGKWREQRILTFGKIRELRLENVDVPDLVNKVNFAKNLSTLVVSGCNVKGLRFELCKTLKNLNLSNNEIDLLEGFQIPEGLISLNLSGNLISRIIDFPSSLIEIDLQNNNLQDSVELFGSLQILKLNNNPELALVKVSSTVKTLDLSGTSVNDIKPLMKLTPNIEVLNISQCLVKDEYIVFPASLTSLELSNCFLDSIEIKFAGNLLGVLDLSNNRLINMNNIDLNNCDNLRLLDVLNNQICSIEEVPVSAEIVNFSGNLIKSFKSSSLNLKSLDLLMNKLANAKEFELPSSLEVLKFSGNPFRSIPSDFAIPSNLIGLYLDHCNISEFELKLPSKLVILSMTNNKLHSKSFKLMAGSNFKVLNLSGNFFKDFPVEMLEGLNLVQLKLINNMFDVIPSIPKNILNAVFNDSFESMIENF